MQGSRWRNRKIESKWIFNKVEDRANRCKEHLLAFLCREVRDTVEAEVLELGKE